MLVCMASHRGIDDFPDSAVDQFPAAVRRALQDHARAGAALRLYRRRGWNDSAVRFQRARAAEALRVALDDWQFAEENPTLF